MSNKDIPGFNRLSKISDAQLRHMTKLERVINKLLANDVISNDQYLDAKAILGNPFYNNISQQMLTNTIGSHVLNRALLTY